MLFAKSQDQPWQQKVQHIFSDGNTDCLMSAAHSESMLTTSCYCGIGMHHAQEKPTTAVTFLRK